MLVSKIFTFDSAHRLINSKFSEEENRELFGKCSNFPCHGHTFTLIVTVDGPIDEDTGMVVNFLDLKELVNRVIIDKLDHHFINDVEGIKGTITTSENIIKWIWKELDKEMKNKTYHLYELKLYETSNSFVTYKGEV